MTVVVRARRAAELVGSTRLSPSVTGLRLRVDDGGPFAYAPGQWIEVFVGNIGYGGRFSIASAPETVGPGEVEIAVSRAADNSVAAALSGLSEGARVELSEPRGVFMRDRGTRKLPAVFIGTGTGVSPLRAMIAAELAKHPEGPPLVLLFGCRTELDILWRQDLESWAAKHARFRVEITLSSPPPGWTARRGYVQAHLDEIVRPLLPAHVYVCGVWEMVQDARRLLTERLGMPREQIHTERAD